VDFKSGINTQTYKYYIDFASKYGIEYIILDEGWYKLGNVLQVVPEMNVEELVAYGKQKNVGIILWVVWKSFDNQFDAAFEQYSKWGIKGLKIDFMQRDDQPVMNFYQGSFVKQQTKDACRFSRRNPTSDDDENLAQSNKR
jgi:Glycoside hydrolase 97.